MEKKKRAGGIAQGEVPEFKPQYPPPTPTPHAHTKAEGRGREERRGEESKKPT
jgi:hypothetical protein